MLPRKPVPFVDFNFKYAIWFENQKVSLCGTFLVVLLS